MNEQRWAGQLEKKSKFILALFLGNEHSEVQPESLFYRLKMASFPKPKLLICKFKEQHIFSIGSVFISGLRDCIARKLSRAEGAK